MKIIGITGKVVEVAYKPEYKQDRRFYPKPSEQANVIVEIATDEGLVGWGEAAHSPGIYGENAAQTMAALDYFRPFLVGRDPLQITALNMELDRMSPIGNVAAKAGIDVALHDVVGKALGVPVYQLLGGRVHERLITHISPATYEGTVAQIERLVGQGYRIFKQKGSGDTEYDLALIHSLLDQVSPDVTISIDVNQGWSTLQALRIIEEIERRPTFPTNLIIEQPTRAADFKGQAYIRERTQIPLMADDAIRTVDDLEKIIELGAADIVSLKISRVGGIQKCQQMIHMAEAANVSYIVDEINEMRVANTAVAHLALASRKPLYTGTACWTSLEWDVVKSGGVQLVDGHATLPDAPGLGIEALQFPAEGQESDATR
ncbi:mandelate racemase/muconate lactonizing enzyme family protein [Luedemannella helvata]|uniref:Dipeptide epimerase n=1 Tax=Luedemannella helvata TaxID=349315 RepID=A0ABN2JXS4_9ACTN